MVSVFCEAKALPLFSSLSFILASDASSIPTPSSEMRISSRLPLRSSRMVRCPLPILHSVPWIILFSRIGCIVSLGRRQQYISSLSSGSHSIERLRRVPNRYCWILKYVSQFWISSSTDTRFSTLLIV